MANLGKWYDPISERWIAPREPRPKASSSHASENLELDVTVEVERIWRALVDCCARD